MSQQQNTMDQKKLSCSICLDLLEDPVTIPCGHSYCMDCIRSHWDGEDGKEIYSCPQCRQTFRPRPDLKKNTMLADLVEELEKTRLQAAPVDLCYAGPGDVSCDFCTGKKLKAVKSCLQCLVSYCEQHLQPHYQSPAFEKHKLIKPSVKLQENICSRHGTEMRIFCHTDQTCICIYCALDEHEGHDTVPASAERSKKQGELLSSRQKIQQRIQEREEDVKVLQQEVEAINQSADKAVKKSDKIFTQLLRLIKNAGSDVKQQIRSQQKNEVSRAKDLEEKLQQEINELKRRNVELEKLSNTENHTEFLMNYSSLSCLREPTASPRVHIHTLLYFEDVTEVVNKARDKLQDVITDFQTSISLAETKLSVLLPQGEPESRAEFLQLNQQLTLDPNTVNPHLSLSEGGRKATVTTEKQLYSNHGDRFTDMFQVLSRENLSGRHYWEVDTSRSEVSIAVAYKDTSRTGYESGFGNDDRSWALEVFDNRYEFRHNGSNTCISATRCSRIGVYLDHRAGVLCFYGVSEAMTLIHKVQTTFSQPLHAGLGVFASYGPGSAAEVCKVE
ncbi:tripartite motif-containing protein 16-like [Acanthochromis polyacanthus]|uniref:tripartite motif-containing protein 16-like n=1 Tax=Acanthochromis polyacanthus TaxID=80966 RepID=UPI000B901911|nr:tripartite motif-containing protein 16-like [Acanthochromis polyacanthus]